MNCTSFDCGAYASCVDSLCVCDDGWSTHADYLLFNTECSLSTSGIYILWSLNVLVILWSMYQSTSIIFARTEVFLQRRKKNGTHTLWSSNKGLIAELVYFLVSLPSHLVLSVAHLVDPTIRLGYDLLPSVCFLLFRVGFYGSGALTQGPFLAEVLRSFPEHNSLVQTNYVISFTISLCSILLGGLPFVVYDWYLTDPDAQTIILRFSFYLQALLLLGHGTNAFVVRTVVFKSLDAARVHLTNEEHLLKVKKKIDGFQTPIVVLGLVHVVTNIIMGSVPLLLNKHVYYLPILMLIVPFIGKNLVFQNKKVRRHKCKLTLVSSPSGEHRKSSGDPSDVLISSQSNQGPCAWEAWLV